MGYYAPSYIFCIKYLSAFSHISSSSILVMLLCWVSYSHNFSFNRDYYLDFTLIFSGVPLKRNMPEISRQVCQTQPLTLGKPWQRQKLLTKVDVNITFLFRSNEIEFTTWFSIKYFPSSYHSLYATSVFLDVDKLPVDSLAKVAAYDVDKLFSKASTKNEGTVLNIHHSLLKEWGPESLGVLPEDVMQWLLTEVRAA